MLLSMGEQQRLSFIRLLAFFTLTPNKNQLVHETLVFLDESTSAIDVRTEHKIYQQLTQLNVWFVTISHRSSLKNLHTKWLQFSPDGNCSTSTDKDHEEKNEHEPIEPEQVHVSLILSLDLFIRVNILER